MNIQPHSGEGGDLGPAEDIGCARLGAIFGNGRSGTTWLGAIVSSHPAVAYRFEPFHRLQSSVESENRINDLVISEHFGEKDLSTLYRALRVAHPELEKPPFFRKSYRTRLRRGRALLWPLARRFGVVSRLFRYAFTPLDLPCIVFKEVAAEDVFQALVERTTIRLVYLIRHPCGTILSIDDGQAKGLLGTGRQQVAAAFLKDHAPSLSERFGSSVEQMPSWQKEALLWRANVERCYALAKACSRVHIVFYENLCVNPLKEAEGALRALGLELTPQVEAFIEVSSGAERFAYAWLIEAGINRFYSVYRDPRASMERWKSELSADMKRGIIELVQDSEVYQEGVRRAAWEA